MALVYGLLGLGLLGLITSTPFMLAALAPANTDWGKLSDISQAYGAVSVVLSAIALAGGLSRCSTRSVKLVRATSRPSEKAISNSRHSR